MLSNFDAVSPRARSTVTEALVLAGTRDDPALAKNALAALIKISDNNKLDMRPFLNANRRQKLAKAYLASFTDTREEHPKFESQLGLRKSEKR
jgi:hypothetical protein